MHARPRRIKYYNNCLFHNVQQNFIAQTGDPTGSGRGGDSIYGSASAHARGLRAALAWQRALQFAAPASAQDHVRAAGALFWGRDSAAPAP